MLSGFVIALSYEDKIVEQRITHKEFFIKRIFRLYPLHIVCWIIAICLSQLSSFTLTRVGLSFFNLFLFQSWIPIRSIYYSFNAVSWCLSDQIFFYFAFPFIVVLINRIGKRKSFYCFAFIAVCFFLSSFFVSDKWVQAVYYIFPLSRLIDFLLGIFLYYAYKRIRQCKNYTMKGNTQISIKNSLIEILVLLIFVAFMVCDTKVPILYVYGMYYWLPMSLLILAFACLNNRKGIMSYVLSRKIFVSLGNISFSFYMIHTLVIQIVDRVFVKAGLNLEWYMRLAIVLVLATGFAFLLEKKYEKPLYKYLTNRYSRKRIQQL